MLIVLSCGALFTYLGAIPADAHNAWPWGLSVLLYKIQYDASMWVPSWTSYTGAHLLLMMFGSARYAGAVPACS